MSHACNIFVPPPCLLLLWFFPSFFFSCLFFFEPAAGLAQSVERLTALREVVGSIPGAKLTLQDLK